MKRLSLISALTAVMIMMSAAMAFAEGNPKERIKNVMKSNKISALTRKQDRCPNSGMMPYKDWCRFLTRREQEQAQTLPIGYCNHLSYNQACDVIGDGWTVDVIKHILNFIPKGDLV